MTLEQLERGLKRWVLWWTRKPLAAEQIAEWFRMVGHLPPEAWDDLVEFAMRQETYMPKPAWVLFEASEWFKKHPRRARGTIENCAVCDGYGVLNYARPTPEHHNYPYEVNFAPCGHCRNDPSGHRDMGQAMATRGILDRGWMLLDGPVWDDEIRAFFHMPPRPERPKPTRLQPLRRPIEEVRAELLRMTR